MPNTIPGDSHTFLHHVFTFNLDQVFHHDLPKVLGIADKEARVLQDSWAKLEPAVQNALLHGAGIFKIIGDDLNAAPKDIVDKILATFTDQTKESITEWLSKVQIEITGIEAIPNQDLEATIANLQTYLNTKVKAGSNLSALLSRGAQILALIINPDSVIGQITTYLETAYQIIKNIFSKK